MADGIGPNNAGVLVKALVLLFFFPIAISQTQGAPRIVLIVTGIFVLLMVLKSFSQGRDNPPETGGEE